jgi:hypothetical protein
MALLIGTAPARAQIELPSTSDNLPLSVTADSGTHWTEGSFEVWVLRGNCRIQQGPDTAASNEAVLWVELKSDLENGRNLAIAYLEGNVQLEFPRRGGQARLTDEAWLGRFRTSLGIDVRAGQTVDPPQARPPIYERGVARRAKPITTDVKPAQFAEPISVPIPPGASLATRRFRILSRGESLATAKVREENNQTIITVESGVNVLIEGIDLPREAGFGPRAAPGAGILDIVADRAVIWTAPLSQVDLRNPQVQTQDVPLELYLEGNIEFRQGQRGRPEMRVIKADRMYYDVTRRVGTILGAELLTPVPSYDGLMRLRAEVLQQLGEGRFYAQNAWVTTSRLGSPRYRLPAGSMYFEEDQRPVIDPLTGAAMVDPITGEPVTEPERLLTSQNNVLFVEELPVFYWPFLATDITEPTFYLRRIRFRQDNIFGTQVMTDWNMFQLLGIDRPKGTDWGLSLDYMSERGFGHGTTFHYNRPQGGLGCDEPMGGLFDYWGIFDHGVDNLGLDRRDVPPSQDYRYRLLGRHRQMVTDWQLSAEVGLISDRNFLEEYFKREWDELKDFDTALELKRIRENRSLNLFANVQTDPFFTTTEWLPRLDHFWLGQPLANDAFSWFEHTSIGYAQFHSGNAPAPAQDPGGKFRYLPWETNPGGFPIDTQSERLITRQELDWPFQLGPLKIVPYAVGEAGHWGEDLSGDDIQRVYGQTGVRASIPFWAVNPNVESVLWNLHGLAHKVVFEAEFFWSDASRNTNEFPLYDALDDDQIEQFRKRFVPNTFPSPGSIDPFPAIPIRFDERYWAVRSNMQGWVTAPSMEIADDLMGFRLGMKNRWQTKRGTPGHERIVDWITLDTNLTIFPDEDRFLPADIAQNSIGIFDYDARWQVGDRLALLSSGLFDLYAGGPQIINVGAFLERPPRGGLFVGVRMLDGPISNTVLATSYSYRLSEKWVTAFGMNVDLRDQGNIGQNFSITRIGESFLVSAGFNVDASRGSWGTALSIEPRFLPRTRLGQAGGARVLPAGALGLE